MAKNAAITIISKNYFSYAKTLAESYKKHHPDNDFLIVLVDRSDGYVPPSLACGARVIEIADIPIPGASFLYRYTILELNTAVKPYALSYLFETMGYESILYLDPDIWILQPLTEIYKALDHSSVVLTPHMRRPYFDQYHPSDLSILQSGTYNLGFIGLRRGADVDRLLEWWMTKCYRDCVVDIPGGLFVDQKWMDFVPAFVPNHKIVHHPGYNVAYWNLHERPLVRHKKSWKVDGEALVFFHFSGYLPIAPHSLSKHQNRFDLRSLPDLRALTDLYAAELFRNGYEESSGWPYAFEKLANGVRLPINIVRDAMQWVSRNKVSIPDPISQPDDYCRFLMAHGKIPGYPGSAVLYHFLLKRRPDVAAAYPHALHNSADKGFQLWLRSNGISEEGIGDLLAFEGGREIEDYVADVFGRLRKANRADVFDTYRAMWQDPKKFAEFATWIAKHGVGEMGFQAEHVRRLVAAVGGIGRILNTYFVRGDLQTAFPAFWEDQQIKAFGQWLRQHTNETELTAEEISLFLEFASANRALLERMRFLYQHFGNEQKTTPSLYEIDQVRHSRRINIEAKAVADWLAHEPGINAIDHYRAHFGDVDVLDDFGKCSIPQLAPKDNFAFNKALREQVKVAGAALVNFAGFLSAPSGMGESARSMRTTLSTAGVPYRPITLPHPRAEGLGIPRTPVLFGWPSGQAGVSVTVANADWNPMLKAVLPPLYWAEKNVGYWVWETEELPKSHAESFFDEIWTPSQYSARAISRTVGCKVRVVPHTLNFGALERAAPKREKFKLPANATLFGFICDPESVLERKNLRGLVDVFKASFRDDDNCYLVVKINGSGRGVMEYETVKARAASSDRIIFVESTLSRQETYDFMKSLDVYVSLHRSEGFGLSCAEAMALGLPVVASEYSGNLEFMDRENSLLVPTKVIETDRPYGPYPSGTRWADPQPEEAMHTLRGLTSLEQRLAIGKAGKKSVYATLRPAKIGRLATDYLRDLGAHVQLSDIAPRYADSVSE